ncbi:unnamed protein product [Auanema sp. JU1783]|nr:unnamed protein product [Auanema sp. JU1783]
MELPTLVVTNGVLLPEGRMKIPIRSKTNLAMLDRFIVNKTGTGKSLIVVVYRIEKEKKVFETGTIALVEQVVCWRYSNHVQYTLHLLGVSRTKIEQFSLPISKISQLHPIENKVDEKERKLLIQLAESHKENLEVDDMDISFTLKKLLNEEQLGSISDFCVATLPDIQFSSLLEYLSTLDVAKRVNMAIDWLQEQQKSSKDMAFIRDKVNLDTLVAKGGARKTHSSSQLKNPIEVLEAKLKSAGIPSNAKERVMLEFERLKGTSTQSSEYHVLTTYLEFISQLPWNKKSKDSGDMRKARKLLDESHDGMPKVKERVMEYLAVRKINDEVSGPILCFSGPPGIGKTSIAKAIANSLGRKFERISLGGIRDESDIRGHRRTYVGAMAGRIIQALSHAGTRNPVILLDEIDKLYAGVNGSPSAALLEVLDPEQNGTFNDHYLNLPFNLSDVMFIATSNDSSKIEGPLADRLEIIEMSGYSTAEKVRIGENHIVPRQTLIHGICPDHLVITREALTKIIEDYTRESGVRALERNIAAVCRRSALLLAEALNTDSETDCLTDLDLPIIVDSAKCREILGKEKLSKYEFYQQVMSRFELGTCFGMAYTTFGGEVLLIEAKNYCGKGEILMTGKLGSVIQESVKVARSWIRANAAKYDISNLYEDDIHIHFPAGAVEKDGPSAGCAIVSALFSLASNRKVRCDTAITGEISLSGHVLPIGGVKEKVLGAHRAGIRRVVLPEENRSDTDDINEAVKDEMEFVFVSRIAEVIEQMIEPNEFVQILSKL